MKKLIVSILVFFSAAFVAGPAWTDTAANSTPYAKQVMKFYVLPLENIKSSKSSSFQLVVFRSIYDFLRIIPSLDVPDVKLMKDLSWISPILANWENIQPGYEPKEVFDADYILYGDYNLEKKNSEKVRIRIFVWSKADNKNIFSKSYETTTDIDLFDCIDTILKNVIVDVLKIKYSLARVNFDINPGAEKYDIYINGKLIDSADKRDYKKSMVVLSGQDYLISVIRSRGGMTVYSRSKTLGINETFTVSCFASGSVIIDPIIYCAAGKKYSYYVDGRPAYENEMITNISALSAHTLTVMDQFSNLACRQPFNAVDGDTIHVTPEDKWGGPFHVLAYAGTGGIGFGGLGVEYFPGRYFWLEAGGGVSCYPYNSTYDISPHLDAGYYFYGDMAADFRFGAGLTASYYMYIPAGNFSRPYSYSSGVFIVCEWKWLFLKLGASYDFLADTGQIFPVISIGFKL
ncbi:MAG: hypothetical protein ABSG94_02090 [Brevinematales bacterium]|jgi:hypothetical protein